MSDKEHGMESLVAAKMVSQIQTGEEAGDTMSTRMVVLQYMVKTMWQLIPDPGLVATSTIHVTDVQLDHEHTYIIIINDIIISKRNEKPIGFTL